MRKFGEDWTDYRLKTIKHYGTTNCVVSWMPTAAGTYYYQCSVHNGMYGTITVQ